MPHMSAKRRTPSKGKGGSSGGAKPVSEMQHDEAMRVLRAEYYQGVRGLAQELIKDVKSGEINRRDLNDVIHERVDGSYWVIYTHANFQVLMCSDNHGAYVESFGEPPVEGGDINWAALAYAAMEQDVQEQIHAEGLDSDDEDVEEEEEVEEAPRKRTRPRSRGR